MAHSVPALADRFRKRAASLDAVIGSGKRANASGRLNRLALGALYEASLLSLTKSLETFLEEYFLLLLHSASARAEVSIGTGIVDLASRREADAIFDLESGYLDWLPYGKTVERARRFFPEGSPFERLDRAPQEKESLRINHIMRNAVAHDSGTAVRKFKDLTQVKALPSRVQSVSEFLRWQDPVSGLETWKTHRASVGAIVEALAAPTEAGARAYMGPEDPFRVGDKPGPGSYGCRACRKRVRLPYPGSMLRPCTKCAAAKGLYDRLW